MQRGYFQQIVWVVMMMLAAGGCNPPTETETPEHNPQLVQIHLQTGFLDELNTFEGTMTKDLVMDGSITVSFWLSTPAQDSILERAEQLSFFGLPDTIPVLDGVAIQPDPSPDMLRIRAWDRDHTVVWSYPVDQMNTHAAAVFELSEFIMEIVRQSPVYRSLPEPRGGRL